MANLVLKDVSKLYPSGALALCNVNLEFSDREFVAVVGGEKSGKSTLLRVIAGLEEPTSGQIIIGDKDYTGTPPKFRDVAMIFRNDTLSPNLTVYDNLAFGLRARKSPEILVDKRVRAAAGILGLEDVLTRKPKTLTAAQRQRVALGRAVAREPKLYLFDDPIAGLDENLKAQMRSLIMNLQARMEGTFIYATKNVAEAFAMASRVAVLREGVVQQVDTPANLYDYPANTHVALLVGSPEINFIDVTLEEEEGALYAVRGSFKWRLGQNIAQRLQSAEEYAGTGKKVVLGVRPEDVKVGDGCEAAVAYTQSEGGRLYAECTLAGGLSLTALMPVDIQKGAAVKLNVDGSRVYLFDAETRLSILGRDGGYVQTGRRDAEVLPLAAAEEDALKASLKPVEEPKGKRRK